MNLYFHIIYSIANESYPKGNVIVQCESLFPYNMLKGNESYFLYNIYYKLNESLVIYNIVLWYESIRWGNVIVQCESYLFPNILRFDKSCFYGNILLWYESYQPHNILNLGWILSIS